MPWFRTPRTAVIGRGGVYDYVPMNPSRVFDSRLDGQGQADVILDLFGYYQSSWQ